MVSVEGPSLLVTPTTSTQRSGAPPASIVNPAARVFDVASGFATTTSHTPGGRPDRSNVAEIADPPTSAWTGLPTMAAWPARVSLTVAPGRKPLPVTSTDDEPALPLELGRILVTENAPLRSNAPMSHAAPSGLKNPR